MNPMQEEVLLPDPAIQPLVHPLDVPAARRSFAVAWWLEQLASPTIFLALASALWATSNNFVTPILVPLIITVCAFFASHYQSGEAWAYIPRKRHDHGRRVPAAWSIVHEIVRTLLLCCGLTLLLGWIAGQSFPPGVAAYSIGIGIGIALLMAASLIWNLVRPAQLRDKRGEHSSHYIRFTLIVATILYCSIALPVPEDLPSTYVTTGIASMIAVQVLWITLRFVARSK